MTNNIKAQVFAMYYFQKVLCTKSEKCNPVYLTAQCLEFRVLNDIDTDYLLLRSISMLTDEEYLTLAKLAYGGQWDEYAFKAAIVPNHTNIHEDILSVEIMQYIAYPGAERFYKDCHIQIDRVDADINKYGFRNDGHEVSDEIIDSESQWACLDYLRSIGIALPITVLIDGKPTTFTVADLEREGVIKIVTNN